MACWRCWDLVIFLSRQLANKSVTDILASVEQHLALCSECREEYEALIKILKA